MATHFSVLAWRIPGTEEPAGLLSIGFSCLKESKGFFSNKMLIM